MIYFGTIVLLPLLLQKSLVIYRNMGGFSNSLSRFITADHYTNHRKIWWKSRLTLYHYFSFIIFAVCFYWRAYTFEPGMDFATVAWPQFWQGLGVACFFMPLTTMTLSGLPPEKMARHLVYLIFKNLSGCNWRITHDNNLDTKESLHHETFVEKLIA